MALLKTNCPQLGCIQFVTYNIILCTIYVNYIMVIIEYYGVITPYCVLKNMFIKLILVQSYFLQFGKLYDNKHRMNSKGEIS